MTKVVNPWGLTLRELEACQVLMVVGELKSVGNRMGVTAETVKKYLVSCRLKMRVKNNIQLVLEFEREQKRAIKDRRYKEREPVRCTDSAWPVNSVFDLARTA